MARMSSRHGTRLLSAVVLLLAGLGVAAPSAVASCLPSSEEAQYDDAELVVEGTFDDGPTDPDGALLRPAAFDVVRYVKGSGPSRLSVEAGGRRDSEGRIIHASTDVRPRPGEAWRLFGELDEDGELATDLCKGSRKLTSATAQACPADVPEDGFRDVPEYDVHEPAIDCATWRGVTRGVGDDRYVPGGTATRGQLASLLARALQNTGAQLPADPPDAFSDDDGSVHQRSINQLAALGIVRGTSADRYAPGATVSRAQAAAMLVRAHEQDTGEPLTVTRDHFTDDEDSAHELEINKAADGRFMGGTSADTFTPRAAVIRGQIASAVVRWVDARVA